MEDTIALTSWGQLSSPPPTPRKAHRFGRFTVSFKRAWQDIRLVAEYFVQHQRKLWLHIGLFLFTSFALTSSVVFLGIGDNFGTAAIGQYCSPGGDFNFDQTYNPWAPEHTFQITLGIGSLTFAQAKAIDVVWDVVVGRGGQFLLAAVCYHVYSKALNRMLERPEVSLSYDAFRALVFERPTLSSTLRLVQDVMSIQGWRTRAILVWTVVSSLYVVAFPTMVSAMTGYSANVKPYLNRNSTKIPIPDYYFHRAIYRIHGADRINGLNLTSTYLVGSRGFGMYLRTAEEDYATCVSDLSQYLLATGTAYDDCALAFGISIYANEHSTRSSANVTSTLRLGDRTTLTVDSPTLTIDTLYTLTAHHEEQRNLPNATESVGSSAIPLYTTTDNNGEVYNATYLNTLGTCDSQTTYMWGFSFILLFGFLVITGLWVLGMYAMWCDIFWNCRLDRAGRTMGFYRGVIDISNAMWSDTLKHPGGLASESKIRNSMTEKLNGGRVKFDEVYDYELPPSRMDDWKQLKQGVPLLCGWTKTWTLMHWSWLGIFLGSGFAWAFIPIGFFLNPGMIKFANILSLMVAGISWSSTIFLLICTVPGLAKWWRRTPFVGARVNPQTRHHWIWTTASTVTGFLGFYVAISIPFHPTHFSAQTTLDNLRITHRRYLLLIDYDAQQNMLASVLIVNMTIAGVFGLFASIMLLVGLFSTMSRWCAWCFHLGRKKHSPAEDTSYSIQPASDDTESTSPRVGPEDETEYREPAVRPRSI